MKRNILFLITIISLFAADGLYAQEFHESKPAFDFERKGSLLTVKSGSGETLTTVDLDKPAFRGKGIAFTYSAKKKNALQKPENSINTFTVFPNPTSKQVNLQLKGTWNYPVDVRLYDRNGNIVKAEQLDTAENPLNIGALTPGIYILRAQSGKTSAVEKLVIQ